MRRGGGRAALRKRERDPGCATSDDAYRRVRHRAARLAVGRRPDGRGGHHPRPDRHRASAGRTTRYEWLRSGRSCPRHPQTGVHRATPRPLPIAGLLSDQPAGSVARDLEHLSRQVQALGSPLPAPFATLSFLALSVIPAARVTDQGFITL
ncbi:MAG: hypothetical protein LC793_09055 [Thermomicrobia bacterium]|nr:hypothetical protein [Thermomicrobia bacterium]